MDQHPEQEDCCSGSLLQSVILLIVNIRKGGGDGCVKQTTFLGGGGGTAAHRPNATGKKTLRPAKSSFSTPFSLFLHIENFVPYKNE